MTLSVTRGEGVSPFVQQRCEDEFVHRRLRPMFRVCRLRHCRLDDRLIGPMFPGLVHINHVFVLAVVTASCGDRALRGSLPMFPDLEFAQPRCVAGFSLAAFAGLCSYSERPRSTGSFPDCLGRLPAPVSPPFKAPVAGGIQRGKPLALTFSLSLAMAFVTILDQNRTNLFLEKVELFGGQLRFGSG